MSKKKIKIPQPERHGNKYRMNITIDGVKYRRLFNSESEALSLGVEMKSGNIVPIQKDKMNWTVGTAFDSYINFKEVGDSDEKPKKASTIAGYRRIRNHRMQWLMEVPLKDLTSKQIQVAKDEMKAQKLSNKTIRDTLSLLKAVLKKYYPSFVFDVTIPKTEKVKKEKWDSNDIPKIMDAIEGKKYELPILLAICHGLRTSEILGLKWEDYDGVQLHIQRALVDEGLEDSTKADASDRFVVLCDRAKELIDALPQDTEFIVPYTRRTISYNLKNYLKRAGIKHYSLHKLRHLFGSYLWMQSDIPETYAAELMGHSDTTMMQKRCGHIMRDKELEIRRSLNNRMAEMGR